MIKNIIFLLFVVIPSIISGQNYHLKIAPIHESDIKLIDSIGYEKVHKNNKQVILETIKFQNKLNEIGYLECLYNHNSKENDSTFVYKINLGFKTDSIKIYCNSQNDITKFILKDKDTLSIPFQNTTFFINNVLKNLEKNGFSLCKIQLKNLNHNKKNLVAELIVETGNKRILNNIVINGFENFPESHRKQIFKKYKNSNFNQDNLNKIYYDFNKLTFARQIKYPEILFTTDTTKVYVYLEKNKPNKFDGYIGFNNNKSNKTDFVGYLDLLLINSLNIGEDFRLYWKSDGSNQKTINIGAGIPYIFKTPFALKANLNIFKQDSIFQNTKKGVDIGYLFNYNTRLYLGYLSTTSVAIQNQSNSSITNFNNSFITSTFEYKISNSDDLLFQEKTKVNLKIGTGNRNSTITNSKQVFVNLDFKDLIYLNKKNIFEIRSNNFFLKSDNFLTSELFRFGGINSVRGFNENSLQANSMTSILTEYRYLLNSEIYIHSILDYALYKDSINLSNEKILGIGFGFGILTKNGLFNLVYANGSNSDQAIKLSNSLIHFSFKASF